MQLCFHQYSENIYSGKIVKTFAYAACCTRAFAKRELFSDARGWHLLNRYSEKLAV